MPHSVIADYLQKLNATFLSGHNSEHTFRPHLQNCLEKLLPHMSRMEWEVKNEPKRIQGCAIDFVLRTKEK